MSEPTREETLHARVITVNWLRKQLAERKAEYQNRLRIFNGSLPIATLLKAIDDFETNLSVETQLAKEERIAIYAEDPERSQKSICGCSIWLITEDGKPKTIAIISEDLSKALENKEVNNDS